MNLGAISSRNLPGRAWKTRVLYVVWYNTDPDATSDDSLYLYRTVCGDFGVRSLPYLWDRWLGILMRAGVAYGVTQPACRYVDDLSYIASGARAAATVDAQMDATAALLDSVGHKEKRIN